MEPLDDGSSPRPRLSNREKSGRRERIFLLAAAVIIAFLVIGLLFMSIWREPGTTALQTPDEPTAQAGQPAKNSAGQGQTHSLDRPPVEERPLIDFVQDRESHHYRDNKTSGRVLIITGIVTNGYDHPRSFVRVKGSLKDSQEKVVAERQVYAGNYLTEDELINLPIPEILARLALKGGANNSNVNVAPQQSIPFMLVFDRLPEDLAAYVLEPVSSVPATQSQGTQAN
jgi:hypothetical protein